jgi:hypothetical protein
VIRAYSGLLLGEDAPDLRRLSCPPVVVAGEAERSDGEDIGLAGNVGFAGTKERAPE